MNKALLLLLLLGIAAAQDTSTTTTSTTTTSAGCTCEGCPSGSGVPVNQPIVVNTPPTIAPPACAIPNVNVPVITPPSVNIPNIKAPCIDVPLLNAPSVVAPPTVTPPTPVIPVVTPPSYTPPSLPSQVPNPSIPVVAPVGPVITLPTPPPSNCDSGALSNQFTLSFQFACRPNVAFNSCMGEVVFNNAIVYSVVPSDHQWHTITVQLTVQVGRNSLQFAGAGISDSFGLLIDNISLVRQGTSANIVVNGDFSSPDVHGSWGIFNDISGWFGTGIEVGYGPNAYGSGTGQECELDGNVNYEITQYFTFNNQYQQVNNGAAGACNNPFPGSTLNYQLEFDWAVRTGYEASSMGNLFWNNIILDSLYSGMSGSTAGVNHAVYNVTLNAGDNILSFDGTSTSDSYGLTISNVKLSSAYNGTNLITNGDFSTPNVGSGWNYFNGGILGWSAVKAEVGKGTIYNSQWPAQVIELDSDSNQRYTQVVSISQALYSQLILQVQENVKGTQLTTSTNLAVNNGQNALNTQLSTINSAVQCKINMVATQFTSYIQNLYHCNAVAIQNVKSNQYLTISQYSCGSSEWLKYFGQSGELDFTCNADTST